MANLHRRFKMHEHYYPLDNSAVFIASVTNRQMTYLYRLSCELDEQVYLPDLEAAFAKVLDRFPAFKTELRPGFFWYYLDPLKKPVALTADSLFPAEYHRLRRWGRYLFRIRVFASRISCEFHHCLTDGTGALEFVKSLVAEYLSRRGVVCDDWAGIVKADDPLDPAEYEDAYAGLCKKRVPKPPSLSRAFQLPGARYTGMAYRMTTGTASVQQALKVAKAKGASLTEFLAALHLYALQCVAERRRTLRRPPRVLIPVNLRKFYPSATLRNFFLCVPVGIDLRLGHYELDEILAIVHSTLRLNLTTKEMDRQIRRNVASERNLLSRMVPLVVKNLVLRIAGRYIADSPYSGSISNVGAVAMPEPFARHIRRFDLLPSRNSFTGVNVGIVSWKDKLSITVGSLVVDRRFEREFFNAIVGAGISLTVESNI